MSQPNLAIYGVNVYPGGAPSRLARIIGCEVWLVEPTLLFRVEECRHVRAGRMPILLCVHNIIHVRYLKAVGRFFIQQL